MTTESNPPAQEETERAIKRPKLRGRITVIRDRCKGCGYCVAFCPANSLEMSTEFNAKGYHFPLPADGRDCTGCDLCGMFCPDFAIHGARGPAADDAKGPAEC
jgi:2-oxoglutarate ferredoxin oxidoreductase subunit delta